MSEDDFVDYYELLQISPNAEFETVQRVFRMLAARHHPDNKATGDLPKFLLLNEAFKVLSDPESRKTYDAGFHIRSAEPLPVFELKEFTAGFESEINRRMGVLCLLYKERRADPDDPGISVLEFENLMGLPREHLMFTLSYLREKGLMRQDQKSDYQITAEGMDYVEDHLPRHASLQRLLKAAESGGSRSRTSTDPEQDEP
jgi:curved DNA-binding protein CbpA